jgi:hypothetical protein
VRRLLVTASVVPSSPILVTLMMEVLSSFETSVLTRATRCNIPEDAILCSHRRENLKSYIFCVDLVPPLPGSYCLLLHSFQRVWCARFTGPLRLVKEPALYTYIGEGQVKYGALVVNLQPSGRIAL